MHLMKDPSRVLLEEEEWGLCSNTWHVSKQRMITHHLISHITRQCVHAWQHADAPLLPPPCRRQRARRIFAYSVRVLL